MADRRYTINAFTVNLETAPTGIGANGVRRTEGDFDTARRVIGSLLEFFEEFDVRATFFTDDEVVRRLPDLLREITSAGHEPAVLAPRFSSPLDQLLRFREHIVASQERLEDLSGMAVTGFRGAQLTSGWRSPAVAEMLVQSGFSYSSTTFPPRNLRIGLLGGRRKAYRIQTPSGALWELPLTSWRPFGLGIPSIRTGGGPRLGRLPVWMIGRGVEGMNRHGEPAILYMHSWAFAPASADITALPLREQIFRYGPREITEEKLAAIFRIYRFGNISDAFSSRVTMDARQRPTSHRTSIKRDSSAAADDEET